jgi:hypothetical protein
MSKFETVLKDIGKVVAYPFVHTEQFVKVLGTALTEAPEVKAAITQLVKLGEAVVPDVTADIASKGLNLIDDAATIAAVQAFFQYFSGTFLPAVEKAYASLAADVNAPAATAPASTSSAS